MQWWYSSQWWHLWVFRIIGLCRMICTYVTYQNDNILVFFFFLMTCRALSTSNICMNNGRSSPLQAFFVRLFWQHTYRALGFSTSCTTIHCHFAFILIEHVKTTCSIKQQSKTFFFPFQSPCETYGFMWNTRENPCVLKIHVKHIEFLAEYIWVPNALCDVKTKLALCHVDDSERGGGLGSSTVFKKFNEPYAPS